MFTNTTLRKRLSYIMLPVMVMYTLLPNMSYGSEVYVNAKGSGYKSNSDVKSNYDNSKAAAEALNRETLKSAKMKLQSAGNQSPSSSQASNYTLGIGAQVNSQTGQLDVTFNNIKLPGISGETGIELGISNGGTANKIYGVPAGWKFSLDYIDTDGTGKVYMNGNQNYIIDPEFCSYDSENQAYYSGLRYCTTKAIKFEKKERETVLSYDSGVSYRYILSTNKGVNEYFDSCGKLICQDDRFGNHILYHYDTIIGDTPYTAKLSGITDSFGQYIKVDCSTSVITVTMPDKKTVVYDFSELGQIEVKDVSGEKAVLELNGENKVSKITYPAGGYVKYEYKAEIPYMINNVRKTFNGISQVTEYAGTGKATTTQYNYEAIPEHSFSGIGACNYASDKDALIESNNNGYRYRTQITSVRGDDCGGNIVSEQDYNFLHLPLNSRVKSGNVVLTETATSYAGAKSDTGDFNAYNKLQSNYSMPSVVTSKTGKRIHQVQTSYDSYGRAKQVTVYNKGKITSETSTQYYDKYDLVKKEDVRDNIDGTITTTENTPDDSGKYIQLSKASINKSNGSLKKTETELDSNGRMIRSTISSGGGMLKGTNSSTIKISYLPDNSGSINVITTNSEGNSTEKKVNISNGNVVSETDARRNSVKYTYDQTGLIITKTYPDGSWEQTDRSNPKEIVTSSSNGMSKRSSLDGFGRVIKETDNLGNTTSIEYNELGKPSKKTDVFGHTIEYTYDYQGRETSQADYLGNVKMIVYDDEAQTATEYINGIKATISEYDDNGNVISSTSYLSSTNTTEESIHNGRNLEISSSLSLEDSSPVASSASDYDIDGKLIGATVKTSDGTDGTSEYTLSLFGDVISRNTTFKSVSPGVEKANGILTSETKSYNSIGKLVSLINQAGQEITYTYDPNGNLASMKDFAGNMFTYEYDSMNRMISMKGPEYKIVNEYYGAGGGSEGKLKTRTLYYGDILTDRISYGYDVRGRLASVRYMNEKSMNIAYDQYDRVISMTDFAGSVNTYTYDSVVPDNIISVSNKFGSALYEYYTKDDNELFGDGKTVKEVDYSNGVSVRYKYNFVENKAPQLASVETNSDEKGLISGSYYQYDSRDRVIELTQKSAVNPADSNSNNTKYFTYNDMNQLTGEKVYDYQGFKIDTTEYIYDISGNIIRKTIRDGKDVVVSLNIYVYNEINELLSWKEAVSGKINTYSYDDNGNMTCINDNSGKIKEFKYNTLNQLIEYKDNQGTDVCYNYNAESLRSCKYYATNSVRRISYYYNQNGSVINEEDERGKMTSYLIAGDRVLRAVIPSTVNGQQLTDNVSWYIKNGKDVIATIDNTQKNTNIYNYNAYGEDTDLNKQGKVVSKKNSFDINDNPYKYSGYYYDEESGMYYCQARYYSPELMRFISRDTYDLSNRYAYCDGDPISNVDPNGHMSQAVNWALAGVAIAGAVLSLIFSFGAASPLAIGLGITGGLLGLGSAGTQAASLVTTGQTSETLSYISLGLGGGGLLADLSSAASLIIIDAVHDAKVIKLATLFEVGGRTARTETGQGKILTLKELETKFGGFIGAEVERNSTEIKNVANTRLKSASYSYEDVALRNLENPSSRQFLWSHNNLNFDNLLMDDPVRWDHNLPLLDVKCQTIGNRANSPVISVRSIDMGTLSKGLKGRLYEFIKTLHKEYLIKT